MSMPAFINRSYRSIDINTAMGLPFFNTKAASSSSDSFVMIFDD